MGKNLENMETYSVCQKTFENDKYLRKIENKFERKLSKIPKEILKVCK